MKKWKKLFCVALSFIMIISMSMMTFAQATTDPSASSKTCTITAPNNDHVYAIFQIFTGDLAELDGETVLSNIKWGKDSKPSNGASVGDPVDESIINELTSAKSQREIETLVLKYKTDQENTIPLISSSQYYNHSYTGQAGYYLIKDIGKTNETSYDSFSIHIIKMFGDLTIEPKNDVPSLEKKVMDKDDSTGTTSDWQDSADYDIGDSIPFKIEATVAADYDYYDSYTLEFHDEQESGLTFKPETLRLYVDKISDATEISRKNGGFSKLGISFLITGNKDKTDTRCTFELKFSNLKNIPSVHAGSKIIVTYESTLNDTAYFGKYGNTNKARLRFSNSPYSNDSWGYTPWDNVIVFTYKFVVDKWANSTDTNNGGHTLGGANFKLEKKVLDDANNETWEEIKSTPVNYNYRFMYKGLDAGTYRLTETVTPEGYNAIAPITFTINADHKIEWDGTNRNDVLTNLSGDGITFTIENDGYSKINTRLVTNVVNKSGSTLPETGGIGTKLFYLVGSVFVIGAVILLVTKKRMSAR